MRIHALVFAAFSLLAASLQAAINPPQNLIEWRAGLTSSAQPDEAFLKQLKSSGYEMVINLAPPESQGSIELEGALVAKQGLVYVNIPVDWNKPTAKDFDMFSAALKGSAGRKVLVHCQANFRGGSFVLLYRAIEENVRPDELAGKLTAIWSPNGPWKAFINETLRAHGKDGDIF